MRTIFKCHDCRITVQCDNQVDTIPPPGWEMQEHIDGERFWLCGDCVKSPKYNTRGKK